MTKLIKLQIMFCITILLFLTGCFRNPRVDADSEFRSLMDSQYSASGSDLAFASCGWPVKGKMKLTELKISMFPDSTANNGRGYADISAEGNRFSCKGKLFFIYDYSYTGGHGYSGGTDLKLGIIQRESEVDKKISNPRNAVFIENGKNIEGELSLSDTQLPDKTFADYYYIELKDNNPAIKITAKGKDKLNITGCIYQDNKLISALPSGGIKLKQGRAVILIASDGKKGKYSFRVDDLNDEGKSELK